MTIYDESLRRTRALLNRELFLGRGKRTGRLYYLSPKDYRGTHAHLIGASNFGKSFYLEHLLRSYAELRYPASLIDPHGDHARHYYEYLLRNPRLARERKVLHFKPGSDGNALGFNPFDCNLSDPAEVAALVLEAFMKIWGEHTFNETPRLERILRLMFHVFAEHRLPLSEAHQFLLVENRPFRQNLLAGVQDERVRDNWNEIEALPKSDKLERLESSWNRLQRVLATPSITALFSARVNTLKFVDAFDRGQTLVANLSLLHSTEAQVLVGTMLVNALYHAAKRRPEGRRRPWILAIDEFPQFVTTDIARSLDELRKFGIRLILANQRLSQLPPDLACAVLTNAKFRAVFGGLTREDAEILARELFSGEVRADRVKDEIWQTKFRPVLETRDIESYSESSTEGDSDAEGSSYGDSWSSGDTRGSSQSQRLVDGDVDERDQTLTWALSSSTSSGSSTGRSSSHGRSRSRTSGFSRSTVFVTEHQEFREVSSRTYWSLDEQWEVLVARLMNLDQREALVKVFNRPAFDILTPEIRRLPPLLLRRPFQRRPSTVEILQPKAGPQQAPPRDGLPEDFRE
jgi:hypothetical protein